MENAIYNIFNSFDIIDLARDVLDRFESIHEDGGDVYDDLFQAMDEGLIYTADQWTMIEYYCTPQTADFDAAWADFESDLLQVINLSD